MAQCASAQHPPPLAEDDDLAGLIEDDLPDQLAELQELRARESPERGLRGPFELDRSGQISSKRSWARPLEMIRWVVRSLIELRNSAWVSGRRLDRERSCAIGW